MSLLQAPGERNVILKQIADPFGPDSDDRQCIDVGAIGANYTGNQEYMAAMERMQEQMKKGMDSDLWRKSHWMRLFPNDEAK
jgi:hypothetical protein